MNLIFPKEYNRNALLLQNSNMEFCYRDMFNIGAIKIKLGAQKTIFCFKDEHRGVKCPDLKNFQDMKETFQNKNYLLVPADWKPFYNYELQANYGYKNGLDYLEEKDFLKAYKDEYFDRFTENRELSFMREVVKIHGTNKKTLKTAVEAVTEIEDESQEFGAKLLNDTLKTEEYKQAFDKEQDKTQINDKTY